MRSVVQILFMSMVVAGLPTPLTPRCPARQSDPAPADAGRLPPETSQFDFFVGNWNVGRAGKDKIKRFGGGVAVTEKYSEPNYTGSSVTVYDVATGMWTQTWLDGNGGYFQLTGKKEGDDMVLVGNFKDPRDGKVKLLRLSFVDITKNSFSQKYDTSEDGGATWQAMNTVPFVRAQ